LGFELVFDSLDFDIWISTEYRYGMAKQADQFRQFIEVEVLKIIQRLSETTDITEEKVQELSQLTLDLVKPGMGIEELYTNAVKLDDLHPELAPVVHAIMEAYETHFEHKAIDQVSSLIKSGNYDDAHNMVKKVLSFKMSG